MVSPGRLAAQLAELGGQWNVVETTPPPSNTVGVTQIAAANPLRYALVFALCQGSAPPPVNLSTLETVSASSGLVLTQYNPILTLSYRDFGGLVQMPWYVFGGSGPGQITIIEILMVQ